MGCPQRWQSLCIHFTLQELFWLGKRAISPPDPLREAAKVCLVGPDAGFPYRVLPTIATLIGEKSQNIPIRYIKTGNTRLYLNKAPKNLKHSAPQKKTCLPGEGKDREKLPRSSIGSSWIVGCMWIVVCDGRGPSSILQASSGLFGPVSPSQFISLARSCLLE